MKYSNTAIKILSRRYKSILIKCAIFNAAIFMAWANPANAAAVTCGENDNCVVGNGDTLTITADQTMNGTLSGDGTVKIVAYPVATADDVQVIWDGDISGFNGTFSTNVVGGIGWNRYSQLTLTNWSPDQTVNIASTSTGRIVFAGDNSVKLGSGSGAIFLNNNTLDNTSANVTGSIYLGEYKVDDNGRNVVLDGYDLADAKILSGGYINNANGDVNTAISNSNFNTIYGNGQSTNVNGNINLSLDNVTTSGAVIGNSGSSQDDLAVGTISRSYVTGDINVDVKNSNIGNTVIGQMFAGAGTEQAGLGGTITVNVENSNIGADVRGSSINMFAGDTEWNKTLFNTNDIILNVKDSTVGEEIRALGAYNSGNDITINVLGNTTAGSVIAGPGRDGATANNTTINMITDGEINITDNVYVGSRYEIGTVLGNATLNLSGGGQINTGGMSAQNVEGKSVLNLSDINATSTGEVGGFDEINIDDVSTLKTQLLSATSDAVINVEVSGKDKYGKIIADEIDVNGAKIKVNIDQEGVYNIVSATTTTSDFTWDLTDNLYAVTENDGTITIKTKTAEQLSKDLGASKKEADILLSIIDAAENGNGKGQELAIALKNEIQSGSSSKAFREIRKTAPTNSQIVSSIARETADILANISTNRMNNKMSPESRLWIKGVTAHAKQERTSQNDGFRANINGMAVGYDMDLTQNAVLGIGYGYMDTNGDSFGRDIDVNSHNFFIYGKYQPSAWYVNSMIGYGLGKYKESKSPMGIHLGGKFDVKSYYAQVMTGYEYHNGFTPEAGLRYINVNADSYFDGAQYVSQKDDDILTAVAGIKFSKDMYKTSDYTIKPTIRLAATYDLVADDGAAEVSVFGGGKYQVERKSLSRFGVEAGVGVSASFNDWDLSLEYNGAFRNKYNAQSGMLVVKYNF